MSYDDFSNEPEDAGQVFVDASTPRERLVILVIWAIAVALGGVLAYALYLFATGIWRLATS